MRKAPKQKQNYSAMTLEEVMKLIGRDTLTAWQLNAPPRPPGDTLKEILRRFESFDLESSEPAKTLLIDALFVEIVPLQSESLERGDPEYGYADGRSGLCDRPQTGLYGDTSALRCRSEEG